MKLYSISKIVPLFAALGTFTVARAEDIGGGDGEGGSIIGGTPALAGDFFVPGYATSTERGPFDLSICGAHLIAPDVLLTAAHCDGAFPIGRMVAIGGLQFDGDDGEKRSIDGITIHPDFVPVPEFDDNGDPSGLPFQPANDIMLVRISQSSTKPVAQWNTDPAVPATGQNVQAMGFGNTEVIDANPAVFPPFLLKVQIPVRENSVCTADAAIILCAGETGAVICGGDSGSPIFDIATQRIVGIVSFGNRDCVEAAGFTRVSAFDTWIKTELCKLSRDPPAALCDEPEPVPDGNFLTTILTAIAGVISSVIAFFLGGWLDPFESSSKDDRSSSSSSKSSKDDRSADF